ncbi:2-keto-4-pentenoate hydratase/2-oxohepta-3-ene-1,7-dioic acid hydratase in catechol pathway [Microbacterium trichothecenolyticum]|uniref:fumarylacetoacetate hydrolase family protein n=1 Tax=Microbacterium trichothecenolyticum TaxID=69370 RepID=UPI0028580EB2|nr:fumarylacetoacetate hydrolase family protein [Microbacterium trichothecenolyticum]MDR7110207.1 2-keto-4-pentenoate hydratase/2-oxohepta-3-ene-1,7-dioic acid hydratase in catechol pathway [Microbacterium trichothecenolyticum]
MTTSSHGLTAPFALARFRDGDSVRLGLVAGDRIRAVSDDDLGAAGLNAFLAHPDWDRLRALAADEGGWMPLADVVLTAPVEPRQVVQAGANYREHVIELVVAGLTQDPSRSPEEAREFAAKMMDGRRANGEPYFFLGLPTVVVGDDVPLVLPGYSEVHDWELELAVVIGTEAFRVSREDALNHVAGYTIVNDVTTRDLVFRKDMKEIGTDWFRSKNAPGFLPTGPFLVPAPFVAGEDLTVRLDLNGDTMQNGSTSDLLFDIPALISAASQTTTLLPGDLLLTGSPPGNGQHWKRFLRDGDVMTGSISGLGTQVVRCLAEGPAV